jgi:hypothetical protein
MNKNNQIAAAIARASAKAKASPAQITSKLAAFKPDSLPLAVSSKEAFEAMVATRLQALSAKQSGRAGK